MTTKVYLSAVRALGNGRENVPNAPTLEDPPQTSKGSPLGFSIGNGPSGEVSFTPSACARPAAAVTNAAGIVAPLSKLYDSGSYMEQS